MTTKTFGGKKITIREISKGDLRNVKKFQDFINSLVEEDAKILWNEKVSLKEEKNWLKGRLQAIKNRKGVHLLAIDESKNKIAGSGEVDLRRKRENHVGEFGISINKDYRGMGLGEYLMGEIIKSSGKLKPKPRIIRLNVYVNNKPAYSLYKKMGFKKVAKIPKQIQYKGKLIDEIIMLKYL